MKLTTQATLATELHLVETELAVLEARQKELRDELLASMKKQAVKSVRVEDGTLYARKERVVLKVADEEKALAWAQEYNALKVDTSKAAEILRHSLKAMPKFFKRQTSEYLSIVRPKN